MSSNHQGLGSPVSPISSRQNSFGPSSQYHAPSTALQHQKKPSAPTQAVSPLSAQFPDSPTRGYLSPVSIVSPELSFPPELLHHDHHRAPSAPEVPQTIRLARGGTLHLQDHMPFKQPAPPARTTTTTTTTRFPSRRPLPAGPHQVSSAGDHKGTTQELDEETAPWSSSERPVTRYLADHQPHRLAVSPTATKPYPNNNVKSTHRPAGPTFHSMGLQDVELGDVTTTTTKIAAATRPATAAPMIVISESESEEDEIAERTAYEVKRRRRNCIIGCVFCPTLVAIIVVFAVLVIQANKP